MLDYHGDIVSDLSALHNVADWRTLDASLFFTYVMRLPFYAGALRTRLLREIEADKAAAKAEASNGEGDLAFLEREGLLERG